MRGGHFQTIVPALLPRRAAGWTARERLELDDGDFLDLAWRKTGSRRLAVLSHGLEGSVDAQYIRGMARALCATGWDCLAWNFRGCGAEPNRLPRSYHSGESGDLRRVVAHAAADYEAVAVIGFSLGGNVTLKYLAEAPPHPAVRAGIAVSAPVDVASSARVLDGRAANRLYVRRFLKTLLAKMERKAAAFPGKIDTAGLWKIRTFGEFDDRFTAPLHGYAGAVDYWTRASSLPLLERGLTVPALLLNALDDPLLAPESFPRSLAEKSALFHLEATTGGGHVGFLTGGLRRWHERRAAEFLAAAVSS